MRRPCGYTLTNLGGSVTGTNGLSLAGGGPGGNYVSPTDTLGGGSGQLHLYRLFGDSDGDGVVDQLDLGEFRSALNASAPNPLYNPNLDADNNGFIDQFDLGQFRQRNNSSVFPTTPSGSSLLVSEPGPVPSPVDAPALVGALELIAFAPPSAAAPPPTADETSIRIQSFTRLARSGPIAVDATTLPMPRPTSVFSVSNQNPPLATAMLSRAEADSFRVGNENIVSPTGGHNVPTIITDSPIGSNGAGEAGNTINGNSVGHTDAQISISGPLHPYSMFVMPHGGEIVGRIDLGQLEIACSESSLNAVYIAALDSAESDAVS